MNRMFFRSMKVWIAATVLVVLVLAGTAIGVHVTSSTSFCLSCHEMRVHQQELALSPHAQDARGNAIECVQCHIPSTNIVRMLSAKTWLGTKDLWVHATTGGSVTLNRREIQPEARRFMDDANCRACHEDLYRNAKNDGAISEYGRLAHDNYLDKNGSSRSGCAGCHRNIAHLPPEDRHYDCYGCHLKVTPQVAQDWYESKHGVTLVRCQVCHGQPDGKGAVPFKRVPGVEVCAACHGLAIDKMTALYGKRDDCSTCHPYHARPIHGKVYENRQATTKTVLE